MTTAPDALREKYEWTRGQYLSLALVDNRTPEDALDVMVPAPSIGPVPAEQAWAWADSSGSDAEVVVAGRQNEWTVLASTFTGTLANEEHLALLSKGARAASFYDPPNSGSCFTWWINGEIRRKTYPSILTELVAPAFTGEPLPEERGLPFGRVPGLSVASALELICRLTGVEITQHNWFSGHLAVGRTL